MIETIETERLVIRQHQLTDWQDLHEYLSLESGILTQPFLLKIAFQDDL